MDWKREAMEELRELEVKRMALTSIPEDLRLLRSESTRLGGAPSGSSPVKGGGAAWEDRQINLIVKREELETALRHAKEWVAKVEKGLSALDDEERLILERFYIAPARGNVDRLCGELGLEQASVYRRRDRALQRYTLARYGCMEV